MSALRSFLLLVCLLPLTGVASGQEKKPAYTRDQVAGTWQIDDPKGPAEKAIVEFARDGKFRITLDGKLTRQGMWSLKDDRLEIVQMDVEDGEKRIDKLTIQKLTDKELHVSEEGRPGSLDRLVRVK